MTTTLAHRSTAESIGLDTVAKPGSLSSVACIVLRRLTEHTRLNSQEYRAFDCASGRRADRAAQADGVPMSEAVTVFHSVAIPSISLEELTTALAGALHIDNACVLVAIMLFARYCQKTNQPPTEHLSHRLMVAALHVAVKVHAEAYLNSRHVAQAAGIGTGEVNRLEAALCQGLRWKLFVSREELDVMIADPKRYADQLLSTTAVENAAKLQAFMRRRLVLAARSDNHEDHNKENKKAADTPSILTDPPATQHEDPVQGMSMLWCRDPARPVARTFCKLSSENPAQNAVGSHAALLCHCAP